MENNNETLKHLHSSYLAGELSDKELNVLTELLSSTGEIDEWLDTDGAIGSLQTIEYTDKDLLKSIALPNITIDFNEEDKCDIKGKLYRRTTYKRNFILRLSASAVAAIVTLAILFSIHNNYNTKPASIVALEQEPIEDIIHEPIAAEFEDIISSPIVADNATTKLTAELHTEVNLLDKMIKPLSDIFLGDDYCVNKKVDHELDKLLASVNIETLKIHNPTPSYIHEMPQRPMIVKHNNWYAADFEHIANNGMVLNKSYSDSNKQSNQTNGVITGLIRKVKMKHNV